MFNLNIAKSDRSTIFCTARIVNAVLKTKYPRAPYLLSVAVSKRSGTVNAKCMMHRKGLCTCMHETVQGREKNPKMRTSRIHT